MASKAAAPVKKCPKCSKPKDKCTCKSAAKKGNPFAKK